MEAVPNAMTLFKFRRLLEKHNLNEQLFAEVGRINQGGGMTLILEYAQGRNHPGQRKCSTAAT